MNEHLDNFINFLISEKNMSSHTVKAYKTDITQYLDSLEKQELEYMNKESLRNYLAIITQKNLSASTRSRKLSSIRAFTAYLKREDVISNNFALDVSFPRQEKKLPRVLSENEVADMIDSATNIRDLLLLELMYGTGGRVEELVNLKISDVNFMERSIILFGKGRKQRIVPIHKRALFTLSRYIDERDIESLYIFPSSKDNPNKPMSTRNARRIVYKYSNGEVHPHMLRHSYATHLHGRGADIHVIQELLGHENISTTTIYASLANDTIAKVYHDLHPRE